MFSSLFGASRSTAFAPRPPSGKSISTVAYTIEPASADSISTSSSPRRVDTSGQWPPLCSRTSTFAPASSSTGTAVAERNGSRVVRSRASGRVDTIDLYDFLAGRLPFLGISEVVERTLAGTPLREADSPANGIAGATPVPGAALPLTVTSDGVWIDLTAQVEGTQTDATLFFDSGSRPATLLLVIALIVLGPKRLPEVGRSSGHGMREFKDSISGDSRRDDDDDDEYAPLERSAK